MSAHFKPKDPERRRFVAQFTRRLVARAPARIVRVESHPVRNIEFGVGVRLVIRLEQDGIVHLLQEFVASSAEAHLSFLVLCRYIMDVHPTIRPHTFVVRFLLRNYSEEDVIKQVKREGLPKVAPEKYPGKWHTTETVPDFFRRVWGRFLLAGFTMPYLKDRDDGLYNAILNYRRSQPWPADLELPNREAALRAAVDTYYRDGSAALTADQHVAVAQFLKRQHEKAKATDRPRGPRGKRRVPIVHTMG